MVTLKQSEQDEDSIFHFALEQARHHCDSFDALLDVIRTRNMECEPQLAGDVLISTAKSAWRYEQEGRNLVGRGRSVVTPHAVIDELMGESQDVGGPLAHFDLRTCHRPRLPSWRSSEETLREAVHSQKYVVEQGWARCQPLRRGSKTTRLESREFL
jgi:hypothetical protein